MSRPPVRHGAPAVDAVAASAAYRELIERLKRRIRESQARAARAVNTELVMLYWSIGRDVLDQQRVGGWGDDVVGRIAQDLSADTGSARGFSRRNLFYMRRFAALWPEPEKVQPLAAQIGWTHHQVLIDAFRDDRELYAWYAGKAVENRWSRRQLTGQIHLRLHERQGAALTNFEIALERADAERALQAMKDPRRLPAGVRQQDELLLNALDEQPRTGDDRESVGIILCAERDEATAKLALHRVYAPIAVSTWQKGTPAPQLPPVEVTDDVPEDLSELDEVRTRLIDRVSRRASEITDSETERSAD